jgi:flagellar capping protein FliD
VGTSLAGFAGMFNNQLDSYTSSSDGAFTVDLKSMTAQAQDLTNSINNYETNVITPLQQRLQTEYSQAAALLQQLPAQTQLINALLGYYNKQS